MSGGPEDDDSDEADGGRPEEGKILSPEELDIADDEHVTELEEGRYVVSPEVRPEEQRETRASTTAESERQDAEQGDGDVPSATLPESADRGDSDGDGTTTLEATHRSLRASFEGTEPRYGFDVTATVEGSTDQRRMVSNDVVTVFESLVVWYAQQIDSETPVEEVLGILLMEANVPVRYPPQSLQRLARSAGLGPEDTIGDLYDAVAEDGLEF